MELLVQNPMPDLPANIILLALDSEDDARVNPVVSAGSQSLR